MLANVCRLLDIKLPTRQLISVDELTKEQLDAELQKGYDSIRNGKLYSADEVDAILHKQNKDLPQLDFTSEIISDESKVHSTIHWGKPSLNEISQINKKNKLL